MVTGKDINKKVVLFRHPTEEEWGGIGKINIRCKIGEPVTLISYKGNCKNPHIETYMGIGWYPACCFKLYEENYEIY